MIFNGFQKVTLLDYPGKVACTLFTGGCNFRCPFCHNAGLVTDLSKSARIEEEEILTYLRKRRGILDGVCITGGEPLMHPDLPDFIRKVKELSFQVKLDTNGTFPERLAPLLDEGLVDYVAMDIKNSDEKYAATSGIEAYPKKIDETISLLMNSGVAYEFRTTVVREYHTPQDIENIAKKIMGAKHYFLQGFTDSGNLIGENCSAYSPSEMKDLLAIATRYIPSAALRGIDEDAPEQHT